MKVNAGLWIDTMKALIVVTFEGGEKKLEILSHADSGSIEGGGSLNQFYSEVIGAVRDAETILIFGPGQAKEDLRRHLARARLGGKVVGVEPSEPMTVPQIAAKVREHFRPMLAKMGTA